MIINTIFPLDGRKNMKFATSLIASHSNIRPKLLLFALLRIYLYSRYVYYLFNLMQPITGHSEQMRTNQKRQNFVDSFSIFFFLNLYRYKRKYKRKNSDILEKSQV